MSAGKKIEPNLVRETLEVVLASPEFASSPRASAALRYIVGETLEGRSEKIKAYTIAVDVLNRDAGFDPSTNPIVRVLAGRIREALSTFYSSKDGLDQPVVIRVPKGSYVPVFDEVNNNISPEFGGPQTGEDLHQPFSRSITVKKFDVFTIEAVSESSSLRSEMANSGLQIELIDKLSRFKDITIIDAETDGNLAGIATSEYILSGKIRLSGARIIVSAVLRRTDDNAIIWSESFDKTFHSPDALFDIQASIAAEIASNLGQPYGTIGTQMAAVRSRLGEMDLDHYYALVDFYQFSNNKTDKNYEEVLANLEKATSESPDFSSAWAALSWMYSYEKLNVNKNVDPKDLGAKAIAAAYKGVNADPNNAMAYQYLAVAQFNEGDYESFRKAARISLNLNPNDAEILAGMGSHFIQLDNSEEGKLMVEKAMRISPGHPPWYHLSLTIYHYTRHQSDEAIHHARQYAQEGSLSSYILLSASLAQSGRLPEANEVYQKLLAERPIFATEYMRILENWPLPGDMTKMLISDLVKAGMEERVVSLDTKRSTVAEFTRR